ncbi:polar amino acid transport system substrate-binding protein [Nocardioides thalensis]|uniref:Polar amino acid transport system substrate-binding protein n=1 Tax=Nocardioides thalensis TaxID=1914755 RepID=A0A853C263_9ACTN|nr:glutamate ABC transporter substrate-binding protein [Nocardioides thalensis]NYJ00678.1 polar amino acid transport system substrate-binding protein [Nocardioides thalensis]
MTRISRPVVVLGALALILSGCGYDETPLPEDPAPSSAAPPPPLLCERDSVETDKRSYAPGSVDPADLEIGDGSGPRTLRVGVSADTYLMAAANPEKNNRIEGFDIEIVTRIAEEIFGDDFNPGRDIEYRVITAGQRIPLLEEGELDMVVRNMTINCDRWEHIAFSAEYYHATQKVLVRADLAEPVDADGDGVEDETQVPDLAELRVCAPTGSTSLDNVAEEEPEAVISPAPNHTGCLVKLQNGDVDVITGDDTVLAGLAAQDPYAIVPEVQPQLGGEYGEPYGVGVNAENIELAAFINQVLEDMRADGSWQAAYNKWLAPYLGGPDVNEEGAVQPEPLYGR